MNKHMILPIAIFVAGVAAGFILGKKVYEVYYAELAREEIESVKTQFSRDRAVEQIKDNYNKEAESVQKGENLNRMGTPLARGSLEGTKTNLYNQTKRNYNLVHGGLREDEAETYYGEVVDAAGMRESDMTDDYTKHDMTDIDRTMPYLIEDHEFSDEFPHHDKISLLYYRYDDVLCEDENSQEVIDGIEAMVGYDALSKLDMQSMCWVRNERLGIDYEILALNESYGEAVHGIAGGSNLTPREKYVQRKRE